MKPIAAGLASLGRGGDSMLVHMQPREVAGLQRLAMAHGGSLTVNPETGLPEASFLGDVLGVVAPIALGAFLGPAGAAFGGGFMSPLAAGLTTGLLGYAITGDPLKGLSAGLGGYGGAGLGSAIQGASATVPTVRTVGETAANAAANTAAQTTAADTLAKVAETAGTTGYAGVQGLPGAMSGAAAFPETAFKTVSGLEAVKAAPLEFIKQNPGAAFTVASPLLAAATAQPQYEFPTAPQEKSTYEGPYVPTERQARFPTEEERRQLGTREFQYFNPVQPVPGYETYRGYEAGGAVNETPDPGSNTAEDAIEADEYGLGGLAKFAEGGYASSYDVPSVAYQQQYFPEKPKEEKKLFGMFPFSQLQSIQRAQPAPPPPPPPPAWTPPQQPAPAPGLTSQYHGTGITTLPTAPAPRSPLLDMYTAAMLQGTPGFAKGGYLDGPGDGMSDSIPATIANKQPARLADGEFVVPADVVSHLGNGSTKAGAKRLYAMMDKVRQARTGTTKQGRQINPNKYLPA